MNPILQRDRRRLEDSVHRQLQQRNAAQFRRQQRCCRHQRGRQSRVVDESGGQRARGSFRYSKNFNAALIQVANPANHYLNTQYIKQPPAFTYGTAAANIAQIRGFWGRSENIALQKNWSIKERVRFQLRAEALNAFNRHTFGGISTNPNSFYIRRCHLGQRKPDHATWFPNRLLSVGV